MEANISQTSFAILEYFGLSSVVINVNFPLKLSNMVTSNNDILIEVDGILMYGLLYVPSFPL